MATTEKFKIGDRKCSRCEHVGPLTDYVPNRGSKYGHKNLCLTCSRKRTPTERFTAGNQFPTIGGVELSEVALTVKSVFRRQQDWESALRRVVRLERGAQWWVGDLIAYGEHRYGETYTAAIEATGRSLQTLKIYSWVSRHISPEDRRPELAWRSHRLVASLPRDEQVEWLGRAADEGWNSEELERELRAARDDDGDFADPEADPDFRCPHCSHEWVGDPRPPRRRLRSVA